MKELFLVFAVSAIASHCDALKLLNNGYEDLYIVIQDSVKEDKNLIDRIKVIFEDASSLLYRATRQQAYFRSIVINVPKSWTKLESYRRVSSLSSSTSHFRIGKGNKKSPDTVGSTSCGDRGLYTFLHYKHFIMKEGVTKWGRHDAVIVHEWGHLRWGLKDEYPTIQRGSKRKWQFYQAGGKWKPVGCTRNIQGYASNSCKNGVPVGKCDVNNIRKKIGKKCRFCPDQSQALGASLMAYQYITSVSEFCDKDHSDTPSHLRHNSEARNEQNVYCNGKSSWEVMREHEDFKDGNNPPLKSEYPPPPEFIISQETTDNVRVLVLDTSGSMQGSKINMLYHASRLMIESYLPDGSWLSVVDFDGDAIPLSDFVQIDSDVARHTLVSKLPRVGEGDTCIPCGTDLALSMLQSFKEIDSTEEAEIILISDGKNNGDMEAATVDLKAAGVVVHSIAVTEEADQRLVDISKATGGRCFAYTESGGSASLAAILNEIISGRSATTSAVATMLSEQLAPTPNIPSTIEFHIDDGVGKETTVSVMSRSLSKLDVLLSGPSNFTHTESRVSVESLTLSVQEVIQPGDYKLAITSSTSADIEIIVTSKPISEDAEIIRPVVKLSTDILDFKTSESYAVMNVIVRKGESAVKHANATATVSGPTGVQTCQLNVLDDGLEPDVRPEDGIYSAYIHRGCQGDNGRHNSKVVITGNADTVVTLYSSSEAATIDDETDTLEDIATGRFERVAVPDAFTVVNYDPITAAKDITPPGRITDVEVIDIHSGIPSTEVTRNYTITWTATGNDLNLGQASAYEMRVTTNLSMLRNDFILAEELDVSGVNMAPNISGKVERLKMVVSSDDAFTSTTFFGVIAIDETGNRGPVSNIISITVGSSSVYKVEKEECSDNCYDVVTECERSLTIPNGKIEWGNTATTPGSTVAVVCDNGYELVGGSAVECRGDGTWTDSVSCQTTDGPQLSTAAIIGIIVAVVVLLIVGLVIFVVVRRRKTH